MVSHHYGDDFLGQLVTGLPIVFGGRPLRGQDHAIHFVDVDNCAAAALGTRYLIDRGRTRIATITGPVDMPAGIDRAAGWSTALREAGLSDARLANGEFSQVSGARAMRELLDTHPDLDSVFVASDLMALGAVSVLRERSIDIPSQVAVVGFDDSASAVASDVQLTTVWQPSIEMGMRMAQTLLALLRGEPVAQEQILETRMVVRDSA